jgi:quinol monooxygenase YgiN
VTSEILYEVVATVEPQIRAAYVTWLRPHIAEILKLDGVLGAELYADSESDCALTVCYRWRDRAAIDAYLAGQAVELRADGVRRFGGKFSVKRRILERLAL